MRQWQKAEKQEQVNSMCVQIDGVDSDDLERLWKKEKKKTLRHLGGDPSFIDASPTCHLTAITIPLHTHNK